MLPDMFVKKYILRIIECYITAWLIPTKICSIARNIVYHLSSCLQPKTLRPWGTSFVSYIFFYPSGCQTSLFLSIRVCCLTVPLAVSPPLTFLLLWVSGCNDRLQVVLTTEVTITCWLEVFLAFHTLGICVYCPFRSLFSCLTSSLVRRGLSQPKALIITTCSLAANDGCFFSCLRRVV